MPHTLILGTTESGKTSLARNMEAAWVNAGRESLVYDPFCWENEWKTHCPIMVEMDLYLEAARKRTNHLLVVDESSDLDRYDKEHTWLTTQARHHGHQTILCVQQAELVAPAVRMNCQICCLFWMPPQVRKEIGDSFGHPEIIEQPAPEKGEFYRLRRFEKLQKFRIDFATKKVYSLDLNQNGLEVDEKKKGKP